MKVLRAAAALCAAILTVFAAVWQADLHTTAYASSEVTGTVYARASSREAYFCTAADLATGIFAVPYTYCVEVLYEEGEWYRAKYADDSGIYRAVYGYVLKSQFDVLNEAPATVYLYRSVSVTFSQSSAGGLPSVDDITVTAAFYGSFYSGAAGYSYVLCNGSFGYITGANEDYPLLVTDEDEEPPEENYDEPETAAEGGSSVVAIVIIALVIAAAVALVIFSGRRPKRRKPEDPFGG